MDTVMTCCTLRDLSWHPVETPRSSSTAQVLSSAARAASALHGKRAKSWLRGPARFISRSAGRGDSADGSELSWSASSVRRCSRSSRDGRWTLWRHAGVLPPPRSPTRDPPARNGSITCLAGGDCLVHLDLHRSTSSCSPSGAGAHHWGNAARGRGRPMWPPHGL